MVKDITEFENIDALCKLCDNTGEPNIIFKDDDGRFVVMNLADYEEMRQYDEMVYKKLKKATDELRSGVPLTDADDFFQEMRLKYAEEV